MIEFKRMNTELMKSEIRKLDNVAALTLMCDRLLDVIDSLSNAIEDSIEMIGQVKELSDN